ncbi:hypothetical protein [Melittangium boletus]|uniref:hypothetical protein n=1 Tax=Melittangium boletus TaxID=83453 RepID=UPI003DA59443
MPTGESSIPISLIRDAAEALLKRPGARICPEGNQRPIEGLSTEYCATVYVAGTREALSWRVTQPVKGSHDSCSPLLDVEDDDYPSSHVWVVGYLHNHPCATAPSSRDLAAWPTDSFNPYVAMAEVRLIPGNPAPAFHGHTSIEMASVVVAERQDGARIYLRYFPTGEIQQWSESRATWIRVGRCSPRDRSRLGNKPVCDEPLRVFAE